MVHGESLRAEPVAGEIYVGRRPWAFEGRGTPRQRFGRPCRTGFGLVESLCRWKNRCERTSGQVARDSSGICGKGIQFFAFCHIRSMHAGALLATPQGVDLNERVVYRGVQDVETPAAVCLESWVS